MNTSAIGKNYKQSQTFRPSRYFKHMRKYLKYKAGRAIYTPIPSSDCSTSPNSDQPNRDIPQASLQSTDTQLQPRLPPDTTRSSQDIENENNYNSTTQSDVKPEIKEEPEVEMCRQFARGVCTRGSSCTYAHRLILSQLKRVYTFCRNFRKSVCTHYKCKFVHATNFEKESFFRTGRLPPHTLAHLKVSNSAPTVFTYQNVTPTYSLYDALMMPPPPPPPLPPPLPSVPTVPISGNAPPYECPRTEVYGGGRQWSGQETAFATDELYFFEPKSTICKSCKVNAFREQCKKVNLDHLTKKLAKCNDEKNKWMIYNQAMDKTLDICHKYSLRMKAEVEAQLYEHNHFYRMQRARRDHEFDEMARAATAP